MLSYENINIIACFVFVNRGQQFRYSQLYTFP